MTENIYLNIAIGLIFIYLIYSIFVTTIVELIASVLAHRHRMLERALEQMLDGKSISYYWWDKIFNFISFLFYYKKFKKGNTNIIYNPQAGFTNGFMDKQNFLQHSNKQFSATKALSVNTINCTKEPYRVKLNKKAKLFAACFTEHPLYRRSAEQTLLYKKPAYISEKTFSNIFINVLSLYSSENVKLFSLKDNLNNNSFFQDSGMNEELKQIILQFISQSGNSMDEFKKRLEEWFSDTMKRVTGWYKKQVANITFLIAFVFSCLLNADSIKMAHTLSINKTARETLVKMAIEKSKDTTIIHKNSLNLADTTITIRGASHILDSTYKADIAEINKTLAIGWDSAILNHNLDETGYLTKKINESPAALQTVNIFKNVFFNGKVFLGILFTTIAISMGAPFWFDLLNRFVNFRMAGKKSENDNTSPK
ncbi:MAG: hypothetical protein IPH58_03820 [Sphingobacteriales bacterium]|jgi:hypothetical protein|nr:hypothetical protein [Sphingobacteriales bacterium]